MQNSFSGSRIGLLLTLLVLGLVTGLILVPTQFPSEAVAKKGEGLLSRTSSQDEGIPKMWDIREDKASMETLAEFRATLGKDAAAVADVRDRFVRGEQHLRQQLPTAKVEYNLDIRTPEVITPDVYKPTIEWLTPSSGARRVDILRNFIKEHSDLVGMEHQQIDGLRVAADYTNPDGNLSYVHLEQRINGIPVFRGEVKAGFTNDNRIIRVINNLAPGLEYDRLSTEFRDPVEAVKKAATHIRHELRPYDTTLNRTESTDLRVIFGEGDNATQAEKMYFPTEPGVAVPAWRILIIRPTNGYYVVVDARTGVVL